MLQDRR